MQPSIGQGSSVMSNKHPVKHKFCKAGLNVIFFLSKVEIRKE